jgi:hypothetical protein
LPRFVCGRSEGVLGAFWPESAKNDTMMFSLGKEYPLLVARSRNSALATTDMKTDQPAPTFGEKVDHFQMRHPDIAGYFPEMLGTYLACQNESPDDLELIYRHVQTCDWCPTEFAGRKALKDRFTPERSGSS